jgi:hypothetical protein
MITIPQFHRFIHKKKLIPDSFNDELLEAVKLITFNPKNVTFAGSFIRKSLSYSADIDISEQFPKSATKQDIAAALQHIVKQVLNSKNYILDIKCGYDPVFKGLFQNLGDIKHSRVVNYERDRTQRDIQYCWSSGFIDSTEYHQLCDLNAGRAVSDWLQLREAIRKVITLRWTPEEVLRGNKEGKCDPIFLTDAVETFVTKIDMGFIYEGFYTEMSNIFITEKTSKHGLVFYPISSQPKYYTDAIKYNLFEYLHVEPIQWMKV